MIRPYVVFCRFAAVAFLLVAVYTLAVKVPSGELADDWLHNVLHVITGAAAIYLGWFGSQSPGPRLFTWAVVVVYGALAMVGWFVDGLAMDTPFRVPLNVADNIFHVIVGGAGLVTIVTAGRAEQNPNPMLRSRNTGS